MPFCTVLHKGVHIAVQMRIRETEYEDDLLKIKQQMNIGQRYFSNNHHINNNFTTSNVIYTNLCILRLLFIIYKVRFALFMIFCYSLWHRTAIQENIDVIRLQREVKEKSTKLAQLQAQYQNLEEVCQSR